MVRQTEKTAGPSIVDCYRSTGIFFCADHLQQRGIESPARVMVLVGHCLHEGGGIGGRRAHSAEACMSACLDAASERYGATLPSSLDASLAAGRPARWTPYDDFAELVNARAGPKAYDAVRKKLTRTGVAAPLDLLSDIAVSFVDSVLPRALRSFDPARGEGKEAAWLTTVFYRYAVHALVAQRSTDSVAAALDDARSEAPAPDAALEASGRERLADVVSGVLGDLDATLAGPLRLYFGFDGPELNVRDIARHLQLSDYRVRALLVRGLAAVAARLDIRELLDDRELQVARALFVEGLDARAAGERLQLRPAQVKVSLASMQAKLAGVLRERRAARLTHVDADMTPESFQCLDLPDIVNVLIAGAEVRVTVEHGERWVTLHEPQTRGQAEPPRGAAPRHLRLATLLGALSSHPELVARLDHADVDLGRLIAPPPTRSRVDRPPDFEAWDATLRDMAAKAANVARGVFEHWRSEAATAGADLGLDADEGTRRVQAALSAVAAGLEESLPIAARREGRATLEVRATDGGVLARWVEPEVRPEIDVRSLAQFASGIAGIRPETGDLLASRVVTDLLSGDLRLPDIEPIEPGRGVARYAWKDATVPVARPASVAG